MRTTLNDDHWLELISQCRVSGLTDRQQCIENRISASTFYYHVRDLRKKACAIQEAADAELQDQEVARIPLWEMKPSASEAVSSFTPSICLEMQGIRAEIHVIKHTLLALRQFCQATCPVWQNFTWSQATHLFLFCGRRCDRIKALHFERWLLPFI